jgi:hypothetical protein
MPGCSIPPQQFGDLGDTLFAGLKLLTMIRPAVGRQPEMRRVVNRHKDAYVFAVRKRRWGG